LLLPPLVSLKPPGAAMLAVLLITVPLVTEPPTVQLAVYVALPPDGRLTLSLMLPDTGPAVQVPPPAPTQVQLQVNSAGNVSVTVAPLARLGPELPATIV